MFPIAGSLIEGNPLWGKFAYAYMHACMHVCVCPHTPHEHEKISAESSLSKAEGVSATEPWLPAKCFPPQRWFAELNGDIF